ncbi:3254_t:CDS:2 [Dentiscutata heterogama]|uniref:3254_t:CDS:1 n=1 Tax=Dentiscutata heterogama TaxID=1316150 RepID=A0ACA9L7N9_9GLOM|nr:3254_t:CDS:2 [Dentiscutata heterogama]
MPISVLSVLSENWPVIDLPPPINETYTALVDLTKVSPAPVSASCPTDDSYCRSDCSGCVRSNTDIVKCPNILDWGLTLDGGPGPYTSTVLDFLDTQNIKVTFFVVGSRVYQYPEILQRIVKSGHGIGILNWSNSSLVNQTNEQVISELKWTMDAVKAAVNITPKLMRPPFVQLDDRIRNISTQLGLKPVFRDLDTYDWFSDSDPTFDLSWIVNNFTQWVADPTINSTGHISLQHDSYNQTAARIPLVIPILKNANYNIKPISVCTGDNHPYVEDVNLDGTPFATATNSSDNSNNSNDSSNTPSTTSSSNADSTNKSISKNSNNSNSNKTPLYVGITIAVIVIGLILIIGLITCYKRRRSRHASIAVFGPNVEERFAKYQRF